MEHWVRLTALSNGNVEEIVTQQLTPTGNLRKFAREFLMSQILIDGRSVKVELVGIKSEHTRTILRAVSK